MEELVVNKGLVANKQKKANAAGVANAHKPLHTEAAGAPLVIGVSLTSFATISLTKGEGYGGKLKWNTKAPSRETHTINHLMDFVIQSRVNTHAMQQWNI